jgi:hypothetical protein
VADLTITVTMTDAAGRSVTESVTVAVEESQ